MTLARNAIFRRGGRLGVFTEPADVPAVIQRPRGESQRLGPRNEPIEQPMGLHLPQAEAAVHDQHRRRLFDDIERRPRFESAVLDRIGVLNDADHAVRVVAAQVRQHQALRDARRFVGRHGDGAKKRFGECG